MTAVVNVGIVGPSGKVHIVAGISRADSNTEQPLSSESGIFLPGFDSKERGF
jgi:hypothetical protein